MSTNIRTMNYCHLPKPGSPVYRPESRSWFSSEGAPPSSLVLRISSPELREEFKPLALSEAFWCQPRHLECDLTTSCGIKFGTRLHDVWDFFSPDSLQFLWALWVVTRLTLLSASKITVQACIKLARAQDIWARGAATLCWYGGLSTCSVWGLAWRSGARVGGSGQYVDQELATC